MDNSSAFIAPTARMTGTTTMNGSSFLGVFAQRESDEGLFGEEKKQLENVVLNNNSRLALLAVDGDDSHHVQAHEITMNGGTIVFGHDKDQPYTTLKAEKVGGSGGTVIMNGSLISGENDLLHVGIVTGNGAYSIILNNQDSGKELPTDLRKLLVIDQYDLNSTPTFDGPTVDQGTHKATLETKKDPNTGKTVVALVSDTKTTSWTTDAVMGLASASQYIFDGEMQALRTRRGDIQRFDQGAGGVWGRYLHNATDITAGAGSDYRLGQNGMELGGDKVFDMAGGKLSLGALTSYSKSSVKQRGESSLASSYGMGLYSTYLSSVGNYIDDVVKFNHFNNELRTHTERDQSVKGSYHQNGYGASLEAGYPYSLADGISIDPYVRAAYFSAQGKDMALSNGMQADIGTQKSAKGELGVSVGKALTLHSLILSPYVTAAAEHEFLENNSVTFNDHYSYKNDQSGTLGKYGIGMTAQLTKNTQAYMEADYRKGSKVESPIMANVGFRINC